MSTALLLPVGFPLGVLLTLTAAEYDLWWHTRYHSTRADLDAWARDACLADPDPLIKSLGAAGLLADVTPAGYALVNTAPYLERTSAKWRQQAEAFNARAHVQRITRGRTSARARVGDHDRRRTDRRQG